MATKRRCMPMGCALLTTLRVTGGFGHLPGAPPGATSKETKPRDRDQYHQEHDPNESGDASDVQAGGSPLGLALGPGPTGPPR